MEHSVRIQLMGNYLIFIDEQRIENPVAKSRKGSALMAFLILHRGYQVPNQRLLRELWSGNAVTNPENALKTLVSRTRGMLNQMADGLGACIVSDRGAYHWQADEAVKVDVLELMDLFDTLEKEKDTAKRRALCKQLMSLYKGDLYQTGNLEEEAAYAERMHRQYLDAVYSYIDILRDEEAYNEISAVCRTALEVDNFDDKLHIELMKAMVQLNRVSDAMAQYRHAADITYRYLGAGPSESMQEFYRQLNRSRRSLKFNLDAIRNELRQSGKEQRAFVCDYTMFKEIYNLEMRNLERLGTTMFLGVIMIGDADDSQMDYIKQDNIMSGLIEILRANLRKGDIITHFAPTIVALLLPTVNYDTGSMVMERIRQLFYKRYPNSNIPFHHRLGMLGADTSHDLADIEDT
ncbi:MAG: winged helix-turn-helix domain-containing protein [Clostridia bacterium]|nr:winged helix-turn-helix domain-containing protein [Clostridia bacterium]